MTVTETMGEWMGGEYVEVRAKTAMDSGDILALLDDADVAGAWDEDGVVHIYWTAERWRPEKLSALKQVLRSGPGGEGESDVSYRILPDQDFNAPWVQNLEPIRLGRRVLIRQSWNSAPLPPGGFELIIDPKRAFGSGYHATTQLLVEMLEREARGGERVLDLGTGSGILAMVSLRLGAASALAIDNDPAAIECAQENAAQNGFGPELELRCATLEELRPRRFDIITANIDRRTLLPAFPELRGWITADGALLVSGLLVEEKQEVSAVLHAAGWHVSDSRSREEWLAMKLTGIPPEQA